MGTTSLILKNKNEILLISFNNPTKTSGWFFSLSLSETNQKNRSIKNEKPHYKQDLNSLSLSTSLILSHRIESQIREIMV
jgi:hypothetical protein